MNWKKVKCECGETTIVKHNTVGYDGVVKFYISCKCGKRTKDHYTPQGALKEWNKCKSKK